MMAQIQITPVLPSVVGISENAQVCDMSKIMPIPIYYSMTTIWNIWGKVTSNAFAQIIMSLWLFFHSLMKWP